MTAPALAIAAYIEERGAAFSQELLWYFSLGQSTLRRRRPELRRLGIEFVERGRWSFYAPAALLDRYPTARLPLDNHNARSHAGGKTPKPDTAGQSARAPAREAEPDPPSRPAPTSAQQSPPAPVPARVSTVVEVAPAPASEGRGVYVCPECNCDQMSAEALAQHQYAAHGGWQQGPPPVV